MSVSDFAAYATYSDSTLLSQVVESLGKQGFDKPSILLMLSPTHPIAEELRSANEQMFETPSSSAGAGLVGWLSDFGAVVIPTFGFFIGSRKFLHALVVDDDAVAECGSREALAYLGFPHDDAQRFERQLRAVGVLVYVSCAATQAQQALELLRTAGAEEAGFLHTEAVAVATA